MSTNTLQFGKYKNQPVESLLDVDQQYLIWLAQGHKNGYLSDGCRNRIRHLVQACRVKFGRHKGSTYAELYDRHQNYFEWLSNTPGNEWLKKLFD